MCKASMAFVCLCLYACLQGPEALTDEVQLLEMHTRAKHILGKQCSLSHGRDATMTYRILMRQ